MNRSVKLALRVVIGLLLAGLVGLFSLNALYTPMSSSEPKPATVKCFDDCMIFARDTALVYVATRYDQPVPAPESPWQQTSLEESIAPEGSPGEVTHSFTTEDWSIIVSYPAGTSDSTLYSVTLSSRATGFVWEGTVDTEGQVTE